MWLKTIFRLVTEVNILTARVKALEVQFKEMNMPDQQQTDQQPVTMADLARVVDRLTNDVATMGNTVKALGAQVTDSTNTIAKAVADLRKGAVEQPDYSTLVNSLNSSADAIEGANANLGTIGSQLQQIAVSATGESAAPAPPVPAANPATPLAPTPLADATPSADTQAAPGTDPNAAPGTGTGTANGEVGTAAPLADGTAAPTGTTATESGQTEPINTAGSPTPTETV